MALRGDIRSPPHDLLAMTSDRIRPDLYISADVETDGPMPGPYSLLSFGLSVVGKYDGHQFDSWQGQDRTFYRELKPISDDFQPEALEVNGLDRKKLKAEGSDPARAMAEAAEWVKEMCPECRPVLVAYPVAFDWAFLYWYFERFAPGGSPFGHSSCLDIRTLYQAVAGTVFDQSGKTAMPDFLQPSSPHTHNALDDAIEQGELFSNLLAWSMRRRAAVGRSCEGRPSGPSWLAPHMAPIA